MNSEKCIEYPISQILWNVVKRWKLVVIFVIIGALAGGAFSYYKSYKNKQNALNGVYTLSEDEEKLVEEIGAAYTAMKKECDGIKADYRYQGDANKVYSCTLEYSFENCTPENLTAIQESVDYLVKSMNFRKEMILYKNGLKDFDFDQLIVFNKTSNGFIIKINAFEEYVLKSFELATKQYIREQIKLIDAETSFSVKRTSSFGYDAELDDVKKYYISLIQNNENEFKEYLKTKKISYSVALELQKTYGADIITEEIPITNMPNEIKVTFSKKMILLGSCGGLLLSCIFVALSLLFSKKAKSIRVWEAYLNADIYSIFFDKKNRISRLISKKAFGDYTVSRYQDEESYANYLFSKLVGDFKFQKYDKIGVLVEGFDKKYAEDTMKPLIAGMKQGGIQVSVESGILSNAEIVDSIALCDAIVLVANFEKTLVKDLIYINKTIEKRGKTVKAGFVLKR